jgi:hypothetical protein
MYYYRVIVTEICLFLINQADVLVVVGVVVVSVLFVICFVNTSINNSLLISFVSYLKSLLQLHR